ncbi:hypothetical protein NMG60_11035308 [Bertholletia excelsa]
MAFWLLILLPLLAVGESQSTNQINQTDLQVAMADMRAKSYNGFVILLKLLTSTINSLEGGEITFFMPSDTELSTIALTSQHLQDFILSHSIPKALMVEYLLHFPTGALIPSSLPNRMITITNNGRASLFVNNARIITPNICLNSMVRCHGINKAISFDHPSSGADHSTLPTGLHSPDVMSYQSRKDEAKSSSSTSQKRGLSHN